MRQSASNRQAAIDAKVAELQSDLSATIRAAAARFGSRCQLRSVARGWMFGRREELDFETLGTGGRRFTIGPPPAAVGGDQLVGIAPEGSGSAVQPLTKEFLRALRDRHHFGEAGNYAGHGGGSFSGRGFSLDLYALGGQDDRGFFRRERAVALLEAVDQTAAAVSVEWRVLYNDYSVAAVVNRQTGYRRVVFMGTVRPGGTNLNWHGPLLLHMHLDIAPRGH